MKADACDVRKGQKSGKPTRPSKFQPGKISHSGYVCDDANRILPWWYNRADPNCPDPNNMNYQSVRPPPPCKDPRPQRPEIEGPHGPPVWESHETIKELYKLLDSVGCKLQVNVSDIRSDKLGNKDQKRKQQPQTK